MPFDEIEGVSGEQSRRKLVRLRAAVKAKVTNQFALMTVDSSPVNISTGKAIIGKLLDKITEFDTEIYELMSEAIVGEKIPDELSRELSGQSGYLTEQYNKLATFHDSPVADSVDKKYVGASECKLKLPELKCESFSGEATTNLQYHSFISQFNNVVGLRTNLSDSTKFTYLKTFLKGYAFKLIQHLQVTDLNYKVALDLLNGEFLNENAIVDDLLKKLLEIKPKHDPSYLETKLFIGEVRCLLSDLSVYGYNFLDEKAGSKIVGHFVFHRLPLQFQRELVRKLDNNFPSVKNIFDNYVDIVRTLNLNADKPSRTNSNLEFKPSHASVISKTGTFSQVNNSNKNGNSFSKDQHSRFCKFCSSPGHNMISCQKYVTLDSRKKRCSELKMCTLCSSQKHVASNCNRQLSFPCFLCGSQAHIAALCDKVTKTTTNFCINSSNDTGNTFLLPLITLNVGIGNRNVNVRFLLDTGSQRSYLSTKVFKRMNVTLENTTNIVVNTFIDCDMRQFNETAVAVNVDESSFVIPFLVNDSFDLKFSIEGLTKAHANISQKFSLQEKLYCDDVEVEGLIGVDMIQCFKQFELVSCLGGSAFKLKSDIIPFGNIDSFLFPMQLKNKYSKLDNDADVNTNSSIVNFAVDPIKTNFDPIGSVLDDSSVEDRLDRLFSVESLGITETSCSYDQQMIDQFTKNIVFKDGKYGVNLPWNEKISEVPHNFHVSKAILDKVVCGLHNSNLYKDYNNVIQQYLNENILEPISLENINLNDHVFIPHRPVVKTEDNVTTKVRIVLNCSIKVGNSTSLNEAAYPGIDLVNNLLKLLLKTRENDYLVISDIRAAFLMIKLNLCTDRNRFTILWKNERDELVAYRYTSIVFGFVCSPFILQCVILYHLEKYQNDKCLDILKNNMYVDNLFFTGNDVSALKALYNESLSRMAEGGFQLRSWSTNSPDLKSVFVEDDSAASPGNSFEKLLGYRYETDSDAIMINTFDTGLENITKRSILSYVSRIFDPLGLVLPIIIKAKLLIKELWLAKAGWDDPVKPEIQNIWTKLKRDLDLLPSLSFQRSAYSGPVSLLLFCDSSTVMYGFSCYVKSGECCNLLFAKSRSAPAKTKTLPTLELMSIYLALLCLPVLLDSLNGLVTDITVCGDSQVALSWVLSGCVKSKNVFANNRVKDVTQFRKDIKDRYGLTCKFRYVSTDVNPADMITRGISLREYDSNRDLWLHGPEFIRKSEMIWPEKPLGCMSDLNKTMMMSNVCTNVVQPIFPIEKYSCLNKTFRVTSLVLKFVYLLKKSRKSSLELVNESKLYWLKTEQSRHLHEEISFLKNPTNSHIPVLVNNLKLFIDPDGLVRSQGRLALCDAYGYDVNNPVLLPRNSVLTGLFIQDAHDRCKHLGVPTTLANLRMSGLWIPRGRATVKSVISKCVLCKKLNSYAFRYPKTNDYMSNRVNFLTPYQHTGVDYTGHIYVKQGSQLCKMFLLVFTCLNIRAVHLELLPDMTCQNFLLAFVRFCNIYGIPSTVYSDNASTFLQGLGIIAESNTDNDFSSYLLKNNIKHVKIPLYSAWVGACWERMIRTIKSSLHKVIGRKHMPYFQLLTILSDVQNAVNSRPLTYVGDDVDFSFITPNSFLKFETGNSLQLDGIAGSDAPIAQRADLVRALQTREDTFNAIKELWTEQYLLSLREAGRQMYQTEWSDKIKCGDVVLIQSPTKPRHMWSMGRVVELLTGRDGITRTVKVVRPDRSEGVYSINHLYPMELSLSPGIVDVDEDVIKDDDEISVRPKRAAAIDCMRKIRSSD